MVPGAGVVRHGKRKAEHERNASASKKAMEAYYGQAGHAGVVVGGGRSSGGDNSGEEATDDESEFSSMDGRTSPSQQPGAWGAAPPHPGMGVHCSPEAHGFAAAAAAPGFNNLPAAHALQQQMVGGPSGIGSAGASNSNGWSAYGGVGGGGGGGGHSSRQQQQQQAQLEQQYHQQQLLMYQQQQQQQQVDARKASRAGGRPEGDEWGWFVDAGEQEQQQPHPGQWGVRRSAH
ncbi:unnamed protein product [Ectocarpus sp. 12 AP-2014]